MDLRHAVTVDGRADLSGLRRVSRWLGHRGTLRGRAGVEGDRAGGTRVRRAGAAAVRRRSPQDDRDAARRRLAAHLGHRVRVRRRRSPLRFDDRRTQGGGPQAGSPLRPARPDLPPRGGQGERVAGRGEDRRTSHPRRPGDHRRGERAAGRGDVRRRHHRGRHHRPQRRGHQARRRVMDAASEDYEGSSGTRQTVLCRGTGERRVFGRGEGGQR